MEHNLKKPCNECPYMPYWKGWTGPHETAMVFHDLVRADAVFTCHKTHGKKEQHCAGYALYMNAMCKRSRDPAMRNLQNTVETPAGKGVLFSRDGSALVNFHGK